MNKKERKKKQQMMRLPRRGVIIVSLIAVMVLLINVITASYSWFTPQTESKSGMSYGFSGMVRSENCTMTTFTGEKVTAGDRETGEYIGQIRYDGENGYANSVSLSSGTNYFRTEIINSDTKNASDISLYASGIPVNSTLAVTFPGNTVRKMTAADSGEVYIVRDAYVKRHDDADVSGPGKLVIEWFVTTTATATVDLTLLYN